MTQKIHPQAGPGGRGLRLGRIAGVTVTLDWSLLIIFALITLALASGPLPSWHPDWPPALVLLTAVTAAVAFIASVLAHELSHAVVGRRFGIEVRHITLFVFGGMAHMEEEPRAWRAELAMAVAGPLMSLALGLACLFLAVLVTEPLEVKPDDQSAVFAALGPVATILFWLGPVNILIGVFNMVPGFPLDGGRVLRALLWGATGDLLRATRWAAGAGQAFGWLLIASGIAMIFGMQVPVFGSGLVAGLWIAVIGWFLNNAAQMSYQRVFVQEGLGDIPITRVMHRDFVEVLPHSTVERFVDEHLLGYSQRAFPVVVDDRLLGLVCLADVRQLPRERRAETRVSEIMTPYEQLHTLSPQDQASDAVALLAEHRVNQLPVVEGGRILGLVTREDILKWLALRRGSTSLGR
ncbi:Zn-dependent protease [Thioflavicoccus mobilis 8321]|uniref:Zinc metalloprotease n=1 Tax=Thioflavicoccus mobilis 8321 TaxID=765912 RepID=L0GXS3_9GAMM|nr:site-2 protease family protein [Thioflavicoccus mobilis]AGA90627.1 Zn-dependent protease [Thioflavicoccus mobilis 8321]